MKKLALAVVGLLILTTLSFSVVKEDKAEVPQRKEMIRPPYLKEGDTVALVAISSRVDVSQMKKHRKAIDTLRSWGLHVKCAPHLFSQDGGWFPADDSTRASDLQAAIDDPTVRAVLFFRGGYGAMRTFDYLDFESFRKNPKWLAGYSDVTAVLYAMNSIGVESILGTMPGSFIEDPTARDTSAASLHDALFGTLKEIKTAPHKYNQKGEATGRLIGGNLCLITSVIGTDVDEDMKDEPYILFMEEVDESVYRVDRMLQTLYRAGYLARAKAIVIGHFTGARQGQFKTDVYETIHSYTKKLGVPIIFGFPSGHTEPNYSIYIGRNATVKVDENGSVMTFEK